MRCVFAGCPEAAVGEPLPASVRVGGFLEAGKMVDGDGTLDVELRLCAPHREFLLRGTVVGLSSPPPARPA